MSAGKMGLVIRDPWYEFDTNLDQPNLPNTVAQDAMGALLSDLGARWVRLEFHIAGDDVAGQVARNDYFINEVAPRHGFKVLGLLSFDLLRGVNPRELITQPEGNDPLYGGGVKQYIRTWLDRARFIADRYQEKVHAYEILNEHNRLPDGSAIPAYLAARLHTKFYHFFHYRDRDHAPPGQSWRDNVPVLIGGLHPRGSGNPGDAAYVSDLDYLYQVYTHAWGGFPAFRDKMGRFPVDGIAYHPYPEKSAAASIAARAAPMCAGRRRCLPTASTNCARSCEALGSPTRRSGSPRLATTPPTVPTPKRGRPSFWLPCNRC
jgi:hypothetical protein